MLERIVAWAESRPSVRAALLTGSRGSARGRTDALSDYDVALFLSDERELARDDGWLEAFGPILVRFDDEVMQRGRSVATRLVLYRDGRRIDFTLSSVDVLQGLREAGTLPGWLDAGYRVLVDKDGLMEGLPSPAGKAYVPERPIEAAFQAVVNEFWWETTYVAKNLARGELLPAKYSADCVIRARCLVPMLEWYVQVDRGWAQPVGVAGRGMAALLSDADWADLAATLAGADLEENWAALFATTRLFGRVGRRVASDLGYAYPEALEAGVSDYLEAVRTTGGATS